MDDTTRKRSGPHLGLALAALLGLVLLYFAMPCLKGVFAVVTQRAPTPTDIAGLPVPDGCRVVNRTGSMAGFDVSYAVELAFEDEAALQRVISGLELAPSDGEYSSTNALSFLVLEPPAWYPPDLAALTAYENIDKESERYRSMWVNRATNRAFVEWGKW